MDELFWLRCVDLKMDDQIGHVGLLPRWVGGADQYALRRRTPGKPAVTRLSPPRGPVDDPPTRFRR